MIIHVAEPAFGSNIPDAVSRSLCVGGAALAFISAGLAYRLDVRGWWAALAYVIYFTLSRIMLFLHPGTLTSYRSAADPSLPQHHGYVGNVFTFWITVIVALLMLFFLLFLKRYFVQQPPTTLETPAR